MRNLVKPRVSSPRISIGFNVLEGRPIGLSGSICVCDGTHALFEMDRYPLAELAAQLGAWSVTVDDGAICSAFIFRPADGDLLGTFRIEPRQTGWQFTSSREKRRHAPRPLPELLAGVRCYVHRVVE